MDQAGKEEGHTPEIMSGWKNTIIHPLADGRDPSLSAILDPQRHDHFQVISADRAAQRWELTKHIIYANEQL